jgi:GGDEF domain-containing protein
MIRIENLSIYEGIYGIDVVNKILVNVADLIRHSIRDVDFLFRNDDTFKILTFNNAEITMKIKERIQKRLENLKVNELQIPFRIVATHVPEISSNILLAVEELENKLIKWD